MDVPPDIMTGIALGGAVVGGVTLKTLEKVMAPKGDGNPPLIERLLAELLAATRANGETLRHLRDITADMSGDHRVIEAKLDQLTKEKS